MVSFYPLCQRFGSPSPEVSLVEGETTTVSLKSHRRLSTKADISTLRNSYSCIKCVSVMCNINAPGRLLRPDYYIIALQMFTQGACLLFLPLKIPPFIKHPSQAVSDPPWSFTPTVILTPVSFMKMNVTNCCELDISLFPLQKNWPLFLISIFYYSALNQGQASPLYSNRLIMQHFVLLFLFSLV